MSVALYRRKWARSSLQMAEIVPQKSTHELHTRWDLYFRKTPIIAISVAKTGVFAFTVRYRVTRGISRDRKHNFRLQECCKMVEIMPQNSTHDWNPRNDLYFRKTPTIAISVTETEFFAITVRYRVTRDTSRDAETISEHRNAAKWSKVRR